MLANTSAESFHNVELNDALATDASRVKQYSFNTSVRSSAFGPAAKPPCCLNQAVDMT